MTIKIVAFVLVIGLVLSAGIASALSNSGGGDWNNIPALSAGELLLKIKDCVVTNGERHDTSFGVYSKEEGKYVNFQGSSYELDFIAKNKYYYIHVSDLENDGIMDDIKLYVAIGNADLTDKVDVGDIFERYCQLVPGRDSSILESKIFWDNNIDGSTEMYQSFSVLDYSNPVTSDYDKGLINEKLIDERPNSIKDPKINSDFRGLALEIYENLIITSVVTPTVTPTPTAQLDSDGDGWSDGKERIMGTNPYSVDSDEINDPQDLNPTVPERKIPGFEALFAIVGLLTVVYLLRRKK